ncbi:type I methionyl aminopeptidase [candidate division WWE3 bacterium RIFOXYC1_FULL_39_7]|uniref:Methionine aminopeptidase n=2 Tax=Katanobacteria TaxID=422282 RepID=A0A1F4X628_UNCKA|nr:MAG: type I methionyl aminopeptidase [candidate division WWE3 bacterium RIFOXYC1_FULL_39_7]OGC77127.1 MAG: type I methionyl aminopeptidase [candidate division WWE3 bacterium RIFOXYD1_FULL_39_9]
MNTIKTREEIEIMRRGGKILGGMLTELRDMCKIGLDIWELEEKFIQQCKKSDAIPACKGYTSMGFMPPFPTGLCISVNEQSVHCFPIKGRKLKDGDLITADTVITYKGLNVDAAFTVGVGKVSSSDTRLMKAAKRALLESIDQVKNGVRVGKISNKMHKVVTEYGFDVLRDYAGHGIGKEMHDFPEIPCYGNASDGPFLKSGMTICIEALVCEGKPKINYKSEWETEMADKKNFVQYEHTVLVTDNGYEIITDFEV